MSIRIAFAVTKTDKHGKPYFGNADKYLIYEYFENKLHFLSEEINEIKGLGTGYLPGSRKKGEALIKFLKGMKINVLVSSDYCPNINMLNKHFIPVRIMPLRSEETIQAINHSFYWIQDEWRQKPGDFKLFTIGKGIIKTEIEK
jgi:predicted Fe-Mo cluster-binding NifX family protein